jgi:hypothetical protein
MDTPTARASRIVVALAALAAALAGCGTTRQYMIPHAPDGALAAEPSWKVRLHWCSNCAFQREPPPIRYGDLSVGIYSMQRWFPWLLIIPLPGFNNVPSTTPALPPHPAYPERVSGFFFCVGVKNQGTLPLRYDFEKMRLTREGASVAWRPENVLHKGLLAPGAEILQFAVVERWDQVGDLFSVDLAAALDTPKPITITVERFTTTTFGILPTD